MARISDAKRRILRVTQRGQHGFDSVAYIQTDPPRSRTGPGQSLMSTIALLSMRHHRRILTTDGHHFDHRGEVGAYYFTSNLYYQRRSRIPRYSTWTQWRSCGSSSFTQRTVFIVRRLQLCSVAGRRQSMCICNQDSGMLVDTGGRATDD